ncbi:MAG: hypothetical protein V3W45_04485, partial [Sedimentisphaerales bacterium]
MSTLTKVLIVLLTISSIFLCGIVVTYVSNADNYRQRYNKLKADRDAAVENEKNAKKQLNLAIEDAGKREQKLKDDINTLEIKVGQLDTKLTEAKRQAADATEEESKWKAVTVEFYNT